MRRNTPSTLLDPEFDKEGPRWVGVHERGSVSIGYISDVSNTKKNVMSTKRVCRNENCGRKIQSHNKTGYCFACRSPMSQEKAVEERERLASPHPRPTAPSVLPERLLKVSPERLASFVALECHLNTIDEARFLSGRSSKKFDVATKALVYLLQEDFYLSEQKIKEKLSGIAQTTFQDLARSVKDLPSRSGLFQDLIRRVRSHY